MRRSDIDRRSRRYAPRQCVSDYGMHKDAIAAVDSPEMSVISKAVFNNIRVFRPASGRIIASVSPRRVGGVWPSF